MLQEYEQLFLTTLHQKLKEAIKAGIVVKIYEDELVIRLFRDHELDYEFKIYDISNKILSGYTTDHAVCEVVAGYKKYILAGHFY